VVVNIEVCLQTEVAADSSGAVPVVKVDTHRHDDVSDRCADVTPATADTVDTKETAPDVHVIGNHMNAFIHTINFPDAVTLGGAYDGGGSYPISLWGHVQCCSGLWACSGSSGGGVGYSC